MDSVYSEGLDGEKSRPQRNQLNSSGCYLCAYCNLQFAKKYSWAAWVFRLLSTALQPRHQETEPVWWGKTWVVHCKSRTWPSKVGPTEGRVLGFSLACDSEAEDLILVTCPVYFGNTKLLLVTTCSCDAGWSFSILTFSFQYAICLNM